MANGKDGKRESSESLMSVRFDDDDDDVLVSYLCRYWMLSGRLTKCDGRWGGWQERIERIFDVSTF